MKIFICHASEDKVTAEHVALALRGAGHEVFLDESDLPPGGDYHEKIHKAIQLADRFVFLISPHSIAAARYTVSELAFAKEKWKHPKGRVVPVVVKPVALNELDPYLLAVTLLQPRGNIAAEVREALARDDNRKIAWKATAAILACIVAIGCVYWIFRESRPTSRLEQLVTDALDLSATGECSSTLMEPFLFQTCTGQVEQNKALLAPLGRILETRPEGLRTMPNGQPAEAYSVRFEGGTMRWFAALGGSDRLSILWSSGELQN